jgi:hypothetical protein
MLRRKDLGIKVETHFQIILPLLALAQIVGKRLPIIEALAYPLRIFILSHSPNIALLKCIILISITVQPLLISFDGLFAKRRSALISYY